MNEGRFVWFDLARGICALLVCAGHLRAALFLDYAQIEQPNIWHNAFYFLTGLGHQSVIIFFVLSGYFVGGSVLAREEDFSFNDYFIARLSRLWVVLIPALIFTLVCDALISAISPGTLQGQHYPTLWSGPNEAGYSASVATFCSNLFFLQTVITPVFGTNNPLWSLANEFWYYFMFPLMLVSLGFKSTIAFRYRIISALAVLLVALFIAKNMLPGFLIWLMGVGVYLASARAARFKPLLIVLSAGLLIISLLHSRKPLSVIPVWLNHDIAIALSFALLMHAVKNSAVPYFRKQVIFISTYLSEISYTLYLFHFPLVLLIFVGFYRDRQIAPDGAGFAHYFGWLAFLLVFSVLMWWLFERNTLRVRTFLLKRRG